MAKKKVSNSQAHQEKQPLSKKQEESVKAHQEVTAPSMDSEALEKFESLKSLNQMLLKEAVERRQQVDSLVQSKGSLEMELARSNSEKGDLKSELARLGESAARLELERSVVAQLEEGKGLRANLIEFEEKKKAIERELGELRVAYNSVVGEKEERDMRIESITGEKDSIERSLVESNKLINELNEKLRGVVEEKEGIEEEKNAEIVKRQELENTVSGLNEMVVDLKNEEVKLRAIVDDLEKKCFDGEERQKEMSREIDQLLEEKSLSEKKIEGLADDKTAILKDLSDALKQLEEKKHKIAEMVNENVVILEAKARLENEVGVLQNQVSELKAVVSKLEESGRVELEKIRSLESEVGEFKSKLKLVKIERDEMESYLDEEKLNALRLMEKIGDLEIKIDETLKVSKKMKAENAIIFGEKVELERQCEMLKKEITSLENTITEARNEFDLMKGKVEKADANSGLVLNMLKDTVVFCSKDDESDVGVGESVGNGEETSAYVMELEMIKKAFKSKVSKIDNMKRELEFLQSSVDDAHKKKSFWTILSSATTLLAAVSLAYVARGH
ncbi:hypothetical protein DH2020_005279 [Rehmannia glutinosa]|uniref:Uncharacterized protein n=1 Tax=Rehmannia glutinosa TaxID=99300 RepID=A0ABR0XFG3_REHGL